MKKTLSTLKLPALARLFCLLGFTLVAAAAHAATLTVSPTNIPSGGTVTATWSGIATPTATDWLALATPGMANTSYISWRYTNGAASGSVPFAVPAIAPGTYELRLFANNGYTRLATSNPFTVGTRTVSGTVTASGSPLAGVAFAASNGGTCTASNASGQYSCTVAYAWSGSVAPSSSGHAFTPASRSYSNVVANQTAQDYTAAPVTYVVSGTVMAGGSPLAGVAFAATNGGGCTSSNASGQYSCTVGYAWSGSVTPSLSGYTFTPASRSYSSVVANQTAQDYTAEAITYVVSGTVTAGGSPFAGVAFAASNGGACTASNASGQYSCTVLQGYTGTVTPSLGSHAFTPASRSYSNVVANQAAQDYAAVLVQVSGTLTLGGSPFAGAALAATNGGTCTPSNASGQYSCTVVQGWTGSVTPSASGYTFTPASRSYSNVVAQSAQDFAAQPIATSAAIFYIHSDHLNTPRLIADSAGTTVWRNDNTEPFGDSVPNNNPSGLGAFEFNLRFPGQYFDRETNLAYNYFRDYDPGIGRYAEFDPIGLRGGINGFVYVNNIPLSFTDPQGLQLLEKLLRDLGRKGAEDLTGGKATAPARGGEIGKKICTNSGGGLIRDPDGSCRADCLEKLDMSQGTGASGWLEDCVKACVDTLKQCKRPPSACFPDGQDQRG